MGLTEPEARLEGHDLATGVTRFDEIGAGLTTSRTEGFAKVIFDRRTGELLGAHILGEE